MDSEQALTYTQWLKALCIYREARGSTYLAMQLVSRVIDNRAASGGHNGWPEDVIGVILQPLQFSSFNANTNDAVFPTPHQPISWAAWQQCIQAALNPADAPPINSYHSYGSHTQFYPQWAVDRQPVVSEGPFRFYEL